MPYVGSFPMFINMFDLSLAVPPHARQMEHPSCQFCFGMATLRETRVTDVTQLFCSILFTCVLVMFPIQKGEHDQYTAQSPTSEPSSMLNSMYGEDASIWLEDYFWVMYLGMKRLKNKSCLLPTWQSQVSQTWL